MDNNELKKVIDEIIAELDLASNIKMEKKLNMLIKKLESNDNYSELPINAYRFLIVRSGPLKNGSDRIEKTVLDEVLRSMQPYANYWTLETGYPCELVILFNLSVNDDSKMDLNYTELLEKLCKKHRQINIFISPVLNDISSLNKEYRDLSNFFSCLITIGCSQVFTAESKQTLQLYKLNEEALSIQHKFRFIIKNRQKGSYKNELRKCTNKWRIEKHPVIFIQRFITVILDEINKICYDLNQDVLPDIITETDKILYDCFSYEDIYIRLFNYYNKTIEAAKYEKNTVQDLIYNIDLFIKSNIYGSITLQDIANHFNLSPSYINRLIKHKYNKSPMKYYMALKIEEAKKLISNNKELPIKDISDSLGFYDQHYFSRVFKSYVGMSPVKYKDTLK